MRRSILVPTLALALLMVPLGGCPGPDGPTPPEPWMVVQQHLDGAILSVWGNSTAEIFAVGGPVESPGHAFITHFDGTSWAPMTLDAPTLWWVNGFASDDVWAVGERGEIAHYDGTTWSTFAGGMETYTLWGVWGAAPDDVWTVGGTADGSAPSVMRHYDGTTWTDVDGVGRMGELLFKVWGTSASDVWSVGTGGAILHYDGSTWTRVASPTTARLLTVRGRGPDDVYAVCGISGAVALHYDGTAWTQFDVGEVGGLMGVWTAPGQPVVISGHNGVVLTGDIGHWQEPETGVPLDLHAAWGDATGSGHYLAGGGYLFMSTRPEGVLVGSPAW
jgi:hypothetical protein